MFDNSDNSVILDNFDENNAIDIIVKWMSKGDYNTWEIYLFCEELQYHTRPEHKKFFFYIIDAPFKIIYFIDVFCFLYKTKCL